MSLLQNTARICWVFSLCFITCSVGRHSSYKRALYHTNSHTNDNNNTISGGNSSSNHNRGTNVSSNTNNTGTNTSAGIVQGRSIGYRTGGFPKFPSNAAYRVDSNEMAYQRAETPDCGHRRIFHDVERKSIFPSGRIIGGTQVPYGAYPWTANIALKYGREVHHHCGGAIIGKHEILTAAHCVQGYRPSEFIVTVGDNSRSVKEEDEQSFEVARWKIHPKFRVGGKYMNDLAVLRLKGAEDTGIVNRATVSAACLPSRLTPHTHGTWCYVTGWGITNIADEDTKPDRLRAASIPLLSAEVCESELVHGKKQFGPGMLCAGYLEGAVDSCGGDSGGPLVCEVNGSFNVMGIVSWGRSCARRNKPGVYTKVQYYLDWIAQAREELDVA